MQAQPEDAVLEGQSLHRANWLFVAGRAQAVTAHERAIGGLLAAGHTVTLLHFDRISTTRGLPVEPHRISAVDGLPRRVRKPAKALELVLPRSRRTELALRRDASLADTVSRANHVLLLDDEAETARAALSAANATARFWSPSQVGAVLEEEPFWRYLDRRLHQLSGALLKPLKTKGLMEAISWLDDREPGVCPAPEDVHRFARGMIHRLLLRGRLDDARALLRLTDRAERHGIRPGGDAAAYAALKMHLRLHDEVVQPAELQQVLEEVFASADAALDAKAYRDCAGRAAIGLDLMFHPRLHTDVPSTPLVESPGTFTRPLYESRVGQVLTAPTSPAPTRPAQEPSVPRNRVGAPLKVTYLPGAYPWHAARALAALGSDDRAELSELRLTDPAFQGMALGELFVSYRLGKAVPEAAADREPATAEQLALLTQADVVVADWADKGALWASLNCPASARMVVRVHSADVLSAGFHLLDWSRVDVLVCVSEHLRQVVVGLLGDRFPQDAVIVVPNVLAPFDGPSEEPSGGASAAGRPAVPQPEDVRGGRTIAMVGWGQRVKDPIMALDILGALLQRESGWRLRLIGADFASSTSGLVNAYSLAFRRRAVEPQLLDAIDFVDQTKDVPGALAGSHFILSTSLRESFHIGVMEGLVAGAVPVVRDWPAFATHQGAASLFPPSVIFETVEEAVEIIWSLRDEAARQAAVHDLQGSMRQLLDGRNVAGRLLEVILR